MTTGVAPFVVFALPRSRSFWLSRFLQYGGWHCGHDEVRHCRSLDDVRSWLSMPFTGTVETAAAPFWRLLRAGVKVVTLRRPLDEIMASLRRAGVAFEDAPMLRLLRYLDAKLVQIARRLPGVLTTTFAELATEAGCARVFEHCLPFRHDAARWQAMVPLNLQDSIPHHVRYHAAHAPQIAKLQAIARHKMLAALRRPTQMDGVVFACEPFRSFLADGHRLFAENCVALGEAPERWQRFNLPVFQDLDDAGSLHLLTARSNGRLFGYVMAVIGPSLDWPGERVAEQVMVFADPSWPGLGLRLQQAAVADLRARGVNRWEAQANVPRVDAVFRRLGAQPSGMTYGMELLSCQPS